MEIRLRPSVPADIEWLAELHAEVLRAGLERLGRFDEHRVRQRLRDGLPPEQTRIIVVDGAGAGSITVRPDGAARWIEHFSLASALQGRGVGGEVLAEPHDGPTGLNVLQGSPARRLSERAGFTLDAEDDVDVSLTPVPRA